MTDLLFPLLALFVFVVFVVNRIRSNRRDKK